MRGTLMGATRLYCMIALILAGAAFLTLAMGYIGLPRHLAEWISSLGLSQAQLATPSYGSINGKDYIFFS
jgi:TRAP-type C4-dicarboxylate transport system permease large subunit